MQEKIIDRLRRSAKKVAAIGTSIAMVSLTATGALAADLSDLPSPFITNGVFDSYVVVGASAATADVVGAIEVATVLGQLATSSASASGTALLGVTQFAGKSTTIGIDAAKLTGKTTGSVDFVVGSTDDLIILDDITYTNSNSVVINATESISVNLSAFDIDLKDFTIDFPADTSDAEYVIKITLSSNQTNGNFSVGDSIKWGNDLLEITKIDATSSPKTISIGTTDEAVVNWYNPTFTVNEESFELIAVPEATKALVKPAGADNSAIVEVNTSAYVTVGNVELKLKTDSTTASADYFKATLQTQAIAYKDMVDEGAWLGGTDWVIDQLVINSATPVTVTSLVLRNAFSATNFAESGNITIHEDLDLVFDDDDALKQVANFSVPLTTINITEQAKVEMILEGIADGATDFDINASNAQYTLPGVEFYNAQSAGSGFPDLLTETGIDNVELSGTTTNQTQDNSEWLLIKSGVNTELAIKATAVGVIQFRIPGTYADANSTATLAGTTLLTTNHTTPSGIFVDISTLTLSVKALKINATVDATTVVYYGRAGSSNLAGESGDIYTDNGAKIGWASSSQTAGVLSITEPKGGAVITVDVTFDDNDRASFAASNVKVSGSTVDFTGITSALDYETDFGTLIGNETELYENTAGSTVDYGLANGTLLISIPQYQLTIGLGGYATTEITLDTDADDDTYPSTETIGNTTVELRSGSGSSVTVNSVTVGFARLDTDSMVSDSASLSKPVVIVGGWAVNNLAKELLDSGMISSTKLLELGAGHAGIYFVENAFNSKSALALIGYNAADTVLAARTVASALASQTPIDFSMYTGESVLYLDTGVEAISGVTVIVEEVVVEEETNVTA